MFSRGANPPAAAAAPAAAAEAGAHQEAEPTPQQQQQQQQASRRRNNAAPTLAQLSSSTTPPAAGRSRVQQATPTGRSLRSRLMPLAAVAAPPPARTSAQQLFSVFTNPLSSASSAGEVADATSAAAAANSSAAQRVRGRAAASLTPAPAAAAAAVQSTTEQRPSAAPDASKAAADAAQSPEATEGDKLKAPAAGQLGNSQQLQRTYCFEVQAASGSEPEQLMVDYNGHDQHGGGGAYGSCDGGQLLDGSSLQQQYVYDEDTGQLCRMGEGAETVRVGRHYLEDCHTGEFFQLAQQPTTGCWAWIRRRPHLGADGWLHAGGSGAAAGGHAQQQQQQEPGILHSLSDFLDAMGSGMAALGLFAQGLSGGLALLCLFMTYIQYATAGREGFLAFYSPQAEMINRTFFTLISVSLVAATSRHAYDQLGHFSPRHLRLGVVDCLAMLLYFAAYTCNLLATPLDDQLAHEARRDPAFYTQPLPEGLKRKLGLWHALNLTRVVCCGLAWIACAYRNNQFVMLRVFEARLSVAEAGGGGARQPVPPSARAGPALLR